MKMYYQFNSTLVPLSKQNWIKQLLSCKNFEQSDRLFGTSTGRGTTWFLNTMPELGVNSVLRHYYRGGLFGKVVKDRYFFTGYGSTRAIKEFALLYQLQEWQMPTPRPIAIQIKRRFFCYQADILLEKIANTQDLSQYLQQKTLSTAQCLQLGKLIRKLHDRQVHHSDLNIHNILLDNTGKFWLIDFDKCQIQRGSNWKERNLHRLQRSFQKEKSRLNIQFSPSDWQSLLEGYLQK